MDHVHCNPMKHKKIANLLFESIVIRKKKKELAGTVEINTDVERSEEV